MEIFQKIAMHGIESLARTGQHLTTLVSEKSSDTNLNAIIFYILASSELPSCGNPRVPRFPDIVSPPLHLLKANLGEGRESNVKTNLMLTREEDSPRADGTMLSLQMSMSSCGIVRL